jgi:hypothetical protein
MNKEKRNPFSISEPYLKYYRAVRLFFYIAIPLVLIILPKDFFNHGPAFSVFAWLGAQDFSYSTGMTRSVMHIIHLDFETAWEFNKVAFVAFPLISILWLIGFIKETKRFKKTYVDATTVGDAQQEMSAPQ